MTGPAATIPDSATEADFYGHWRAATAEVEDEVALALAGGCLADRFAWVFMSGYQAALRRCFPEFRVRGWTCLAVAEPKEGPACTLEPGPAGLRLNGRKSWIAGADTVETLIVSVGADTDRRFVRVPVTAPGVAVTNPRSPTFLSQLSQGTAGFDDTPIDADTLLANPGRAQWFRGAEPLYVLLALNACLKQHAEALQDAEVPRRAEAAIASARELPEQLGDKSRIVPGLSDFRAATTAVVEAAARLTARFPPSLRASWAADEMLFGMFGVGGARS